MHRSRLGTIVIDCQSDDIDTAAAWWGNALGYPVVRRFEQGDEIYRGLAGDPTQPKLLLQKVAHESRVHLDIETDNVEAEASRLVALGARRVKKVREWWVLEAPTGHRFCVVPPQREDFQANSTIWKDEGGA